jgi:hypothetical protein
MPVYTTLVLSLLLPAAARAQGAPGTPVPASRAVEEVVVTQSASGEELRGRLVELSPTTLAMLVNGRRIDLPLDSVIRIDVRNDSLKNGTAIGAVIMGSLTALGCAIGEGRGSQCATALVFNTGIGALMGAGVDALHKGRTTIYSKPAPSPRPAASAGPRVLFKLRF